MTESNVLTKMGKLLDTLVVDKANAIPAEIKTLITDLDNCFSELKVEKTEEAKKLTFEQNRQVQRLTETLKQEVKPIVAGYPNWAVLISLSKILIEFGTVGGKHV